MRSPFSMRLRVVAPPASNAVPPPRIRALVVRVCFVLLAALYASSALTPRVALTQNARALIATVPAPIVSIPAPIATASMPIIPATSLDISQDLSDIFVLPAHRIFWRRESSGERSFLL